MKYVNLYIQEEVDDTNLTEMQIKEKGREQFKQEILTALLLDVNSKSNPPTHEFDDLFKQMSWSIEPEPELTWAQEVEKDAKEYIKENLLDAVIEALINGNDIKQIFSWHIEHSDTWYEYDAPTMDETEALNVIANLSSFEPRECDIYGKRSIEEQLIEKGQETYKNALEYEIPEQLEQLENDIDIHEIELDTMNEVLTKEDDATMESDHVDLSDEDQMVDWAKENKENWDETLEKKVKTKVVALTSATT